MIRNAALCITLSSALLASACQPQSGPEEIQQALPAADAVKIKLPGDDVQQLALGEIADTYMWTRAITTTFNAGAGFVLVLVNAIVHTPPTSVDGNTYVWGPGSKALDPADYRLTVIANDDGTYSWSLDGQNKSDPSAGFLTLISGLAVPGAPNRGSGNFSLDFDNMAIVNPIDNPDARGSIDVEYDLENRDDTDATLSMHIESTADDGTPVAADYAYGEAADGSGNFVFSFSADLDDDGSLAEDARIRSRWQADGAGRSDVRATNGDLGNDQITFSQCWDTQFRSVYENLFAPTGDETACVFSDMELP